MYDRAKKYSIWILAPVAALYVIHFAELLLWIASALVWAFLFFQLLGFVAGICVSILSDLGVDCKVALKNLRLHKYWPTFHWGIDTACWLTEDLGKEKE